MSIFEDDLLRETLRIPFLTRLIKLRRFRLPMRRVRVIHNVVRYLDRAKRILIRRNSRYSLYRYVRFTLLRFGPRLRPTCWRHTGRLIRLNVMSRMSVRLIECLSPALVALLRTSVLVRCTWKWFRVDVRLRQKSARAVFRIRAKCRNTWLGSVGVNHVSRTALRTNLM